MLLVNVVLGDALKVFGLDLFNSTSSAFKLFPGQEHHNFEIDDLVDALLNPLHLLRGF